MDRIQRGLCAVEKGKRLTWLEIAELLHLIEVYRYWGGETNSFNEWLGTYFPYFGVKPAMLRRRLNAARTLWRLSKKYQEKGVTLPGLETLADTLGPERFELLEKLERVVPEEQFEKIAMKTFAHQMTRDELKQLWAGYRGVLGGQTAQGRGWDPPKVNTNNKEQFNTLQKTMALEALKAESRTTREGALVTGFQRVFGNVKIGGDLFINDIEFLAIKVVKEHGLALKFHGYLYKRSDRTPWPKETEAFTYCDYVWYVVPGSDIDGMEVGRLEALVPPHVGFLMLWGDELDEFKAAECPSLEAERRDALLSALFLMF